MFDDFFAKADELRSAGVPFATAVVVRAERPTSGKPGDRAIVTADGTMFGWIGGSCAQPTVVREAVRALADGTARLVRLSKEPGGAGGRAGIVDVPMTCYGGGTLEIFVEPHQPAPRLLIVGKLPVARALAHLGKALGYRILSAGPEAGETLAQADERLTWSEVAGRVTPLTFAIVATHGEYDEPALETLLDTEAPYIGLVASQKRGAAVLDVLRASGVAEDRLSRVRFPAGLDIGARRGDEIAVSIIAEIVQTLRGLPEIDWQAETSQAESSRADAPPEPGAGDEGPGHAVDPVCGMTVDVKAATPSAEHDGRTFYFCCPGCAARFEADPAAFLTG